MAVRLGTDIDSKGCLESGNNMVAAPHRIPRYCMLTQFAQPFDMNRYAIWVTSLLHTWGRPLNDAAEANNFLIRTQKVMPIVSPRTLAHRF